MHMLANQPHVSYRPAESVHNPVLKEAFGETQGFIITYRRHEKEHVNFKAIRSKKQKKTKTKNTMLSEQEKNKDN